MFKVKDKCSGTIHSVYSVYLFAGIHRSVFLMYDNNLKQWQWNDAMQYEPYIEVTE